ncbi:MAG: CHAT domain-containing protein [Acidobacteria bacterium]|nr:CHAT domain-containing protein [Acidobacteriota bacterium]
MAETHREFRHFREAFDGYDRVVEMNSKNPEVQFDDYLAAKGRLLCLVALGRADEAEAEFQRTFDLAEKYRSKIVDSESRNGSSRTIRPFTTLPSKMPSDWAIQNGHWRISNFQRRERCLISSTTEHPWTKSSGDFRMSQSHCQSLSSADGCPRRPVSSNSRSRVNEPMSGSSAATLSNRLSCRSAVTRSKILPINFSFWFAIKNAPAETVREASVAAFERILEPVIERIPPEARIVFVPDKALYRMPFAALFSEKQGRYLIESRTIALAPSANVFVRTSEIAAVRSKLPENALVVGNPEFDRQANPDLDDLPSAESESKSVAPNLPGATIKTGRAATRREIVGRLPSVGVFHFAGHYVVNDSSAPNSRLLLSKTEDDDGSLRVSELANLRLPKSKLVVLSACDTSGERLSEGEGQRASRRHFLRSARRSSSPGWKVDSDATAKLMTVFHENRSRGMTASDALRQAQISLAKGSGEFAAPYFWAAFSSIGGFEK